MSTINKHQSFPTEESSLPLTFYIICIYPHMTELTFNNQKDLEILICFSLLSRSSFKITIEEEEVEKKKDFLNFVKFFSPNTKYTIDDNNLLHFVPGSLMGGLLKLEVKSIPYCLKNLMIIAPFMKESLNFEMKGITNDKESVDSFKTIFFTIFKLFNIPGFNIDVKKRGFGPIGEGVVKFKISNVRQIENIERAEECFFEKIRGLVITSRISSDYSHRMIKEIKDKLSDLGPTKVLNIVNNRSDSGPSPGYECTISAESRLSFFYYTCSSTVEMASPEEMAQNCSKELLKSMSKGGLYDQKIMPFIISFMGLAKNVGSVRCGILDEKSLRVLNYLKDFFDVEHAITKEGNDNILTIIGCGYKNVFKPL